MINNEKNEDIELFNDLISFFKKKQNAFREEEFKTETMFGSMYKRFSSSLIFDKDRTKDQF